MQDTKLDEFIKSAVKPDMVCLDIGANVGYYTELMCEVGARVVYAFEPDIQNFTNLLKNTIDLDKGVRFLINKAVTNFIGRTALYRCHSDSGMHRIYKTQWADSITLVECTTIDDKDLHQLDFVKIDVEGSELGVLEGMGKTITKFKPTMVIEFHPPSLEEYDKDSPKAIYNFLKRHYKKVGLLATSYLEGSVTVDNISYDDLILQTRDNPARNIFVRGV